MNNILKPLIKAISSVFVAIGAFWLLSCSQLTTHRVGPSFSPSPQQPAVAAIAVSNAPVEHWCTIPYSPVDSHSPDEPPQPQLELTIEHGGRWVSGVGLVDSGSDNILFPLSFARRLGIHLSRANRSTSWGVGGSAVEYEAVVTLHLNLCGQEFHYPVMVGFSKGAENEGIGLLGQEGFLDHFHVVFRKSEGTFAVAPAPNVLKPPSTTANHSAAVSMRVFV
jgi:hypothetical protein